MGSDNDQRLRPKQRRQETLTVSIEREEWKGVCSCSGLGQNVTGLNYGPSNNSSDWNPNLDDQIKPGKSIVTRDSGLKTGSMNS